MNKTDFAKKLKQLQQTHAQLIRRKNRPQKNGNGIFDRYEHPVLTAEHTPLTWRYDFDHASNPHLMTRLGVNCVFNVGAMEWNGSIVLMARVEGWDRKSFFAVAESRNGVDNFQFWDYPVRMPELEDKETNLYDMRLVRHEDGWIYGLFCAERHDDSKPNDLVRGHRALRHRAHEGSGEMGTAAGFENARAASAQLRAASGICERQICLLHAADERFCRDRAAATASAGDLCDDITNAVVKKESIIDPRFYHSIKEGKNGLGPAPIKTKKGWLHLAHGVRNTAAGMRYVLYLFLCDLKDPSKQISAPGGHFMGPENDERVGDVSNVVFANGWVARTNGDVFIYYGSSDTRTHVATTTVEKLLDYVTNTPPDARRSKLCVDQRCELIAKNLGRKSAVQTAA